MGMKAEAEYTLSVYARRGAGNTSALNVTLVPVVRVDEVSSSVRTVRRPIPLIPYYAGANRGPGEMTVWFPAKITDVDLIA